MRIDDVKDHIGEEWVTNRGSYDATIHRHARVRIEEVVTTEGRKHYDFHTRGYVARKVRMVKITHLHTETGEPVVWTGLNQAHGYKAGDPVTYLIEAKQLDQPWQGWWDATQGERERNARIRDARHRLDVFLREEDGWAAGTAGGNSLTLSLTGAEHLADLLEAHVPGQDEEG